MPNNIRYSNHNVLTISKPCEYKVGDTFWIEGDGFYSDYYVFDGLIITHLAYTGFGGVNLHFDWVQWAQAKKNRRVFDKTNTKSRKVCNQLPKLVY